MISRFECGATLQDTKDMWMAHHEKRAKVYLSFKKKTREERSTVEFLGKMRVRLDQVEEL